MVCEKPPPLLQGVTEGESYNYGDFVMYSCLPGFTMKVPIVTNDLQRDFDSFEQFSGSQPIGKDKNVCLSHAVFQQRPA